ncbi:MAG: 30S ribosome-binding factor RbfA [Burkholderiales bacterium]|nr:30S ribosome-binding factor RbfA [Burkholderiales bacterium]
MARGGRERRIGQEMQRLLPELIRSEVKDPRVRGIVTITDVDVSPDLAHAKVFVTVLSTDQTTEATLEGLNHGAPFLRSALSKLMRVRSVPAIRFVYDESVDRGVRLTRLIESAVAEPDRNKEDEG